MLVVLGLGWHATWHSSRAVAVHLPAWCRKDQEMPIKVLHGWVSSPITRKVCDPWGFGGVIWTRANLPG